MSLTLEQLKGSFKENGYICSESTALTVYLAIELKKPLLIEGLPGVGKTEMGKVLARILQTELIRLQCYEGLDEAKALYEWNYQKQLLRIQLNRNLEKEQIREEDLFSREYLLERPLLKAIQADERVVLLIDEVDKCDPEFEAFLFEALSDYQVSVPELGTITAKNIPVVVLTSNSDRELSDGLKRRCLYLFLDFPTLEEETLIIQSKVPKINAMLARDIAIIAANMRSQPNIRKKPSVAESIDWAESLVSLHKSTLDSDLVAATLNLVLKNRNDQKLFHDSFKPEDLDKILRKGRFNGGLKNCP